MVGFDDVALAAYVDPPLTTLSQSTAEMGYWAVARAGRAAASAGRPDEAAERIVARAEARVRRRR